MHNIVVNDVSNIRPIAGRPGIAILVRRAQLNKDGPAGLESSDPRKFPTAQQLLERGSPVRSKGLTAAKRQFVNIAENKSLPSVEIRTAAVHFQVSRILGNIAAGGVVNRMSVRVRHQKRQSGPEPPLQSPEQAVIDRTSRTLKNGHRAERRQGTPRLDFRLDKSWYRIGLIDIYGSDQPCPLAPNVAHLEEHVFWKLPLITQIPILDVCIAKIWID